MPIHGAVMKFISHGQTLLTLTNLKKFTSLYLRSETKCRPLPQKRMKENIARRLCPNFQCACVKHESFVFGKRYTRGAYHLGFTNYSPKNLGKPIICKNSFTNYGKTLITVNLVPMFSSFISLLSR